MARGRKKESAAILEFKGLSHKTKAELDERRSGSVSIGCMDFVEPMYVAQDQEAHQKWVWLVDLYKSCERLHGHITSAMVDQMAAYCMLHSQFVYLMQIREVKKGDAQQSEFERRALKIIPEMNKLGKDLLLDYFQQAKVALPKEEKQEDPHAAMFGE